MLIFFVILAILVICIDIGNFITAEGFSLLFLAQTNVIAMKNAVVDGG